MFGKINILHYELPYFCGIFKNKFRSELVMKYKRLTAEELQALEKEFVNFLAAAQITGRDWEKMKKQEIEKAEELVDVFSDVVYDKVMSKIEFLEYRDEKTLNIFNCKNDRIILLGLRVKEHSPFNLTDSDLFTKWDRSNTGAINIIRTEKEYSKERGVEIFELLQTGCLITDDRLFNVLQSL